MNDLDVRHWLRGLGAALALILPWSAIAQSIDYDPRRASELRPCDDHHWRGRVNEARSCYTALLQASNVTTQAEAAWALGDLRAANDLFRQAAQANERSAQPRIRWGRLFLQTHQYGDAVAVFREALERSPDDVHAKLGLATVLVERFEGEAETLVQEALQADEQLLEGQLLTARMALEQGQFEATERALERATQIANRQKLPLLEVHTLRAALELSRHQRYDNWVKRVLDYNPRYGTVYERLAHFEIMRRRYTQATEFLREAVKIQPDLWSAHAELGANLMRLGDIDGAREHLATAYSGDPYSPTTVNSLRLLDRIDEFDVSTTRVTVPALRGGDLPVDVRLRMHRKEAAALKPYVIELVRDSIAAFTQRYQFEPQEAVTVELYNDHDDFAVRVAALPGIGLLGVTFGYVVAMDSPSGRAAGDFHWGSTLWHEMAHVFTLEATDHRVPRWLSEGISVFEEWRTGPTPGVVLPPDMIEAIHENRLLPVAELDAGFIRPTYPNQVQVSYNQSGLICLFIEEKWGFERLVALLKQFTRNTTTAAAVQDTFRIKPEEFDQQFNAFVKERFSTILAGMDDFQRAYAEARQAMQKEAWSEAADAARRAVALYPQHVGPGSPHVILARALDKQGQRAAALTALDTYRRAGGWDPGALRELARWYEEVGQTANAVDVLRALNYVDPLNPEQHAKLGEQLLASGQAQAALQEFRVLLALDAHDSAPANFGAARALRVLGDHPAGRRHLLDALATAPHYKPAQELLLQMIEERSKDE